MKFRAYRIHIQFIPTIAYEDECEHNAKIFDVNKFDVNLGLSISIAKQFNMEP